MQKGDKMPNGYVLGVGRTPLNLTEAQIRYAMKNSKSNSGAARFLNISLTTFEKYSKMYIDETTGKSLWDLHKNQKGVGVTKPYNVDKGKYSLQRVLDGEYPEYSVHLLKKRLINNADKMNHMDDNWHNHKRDNIRFLCYNCFHNLRGNLRGRQPEWRVEQIEKAKELYNQQQKEKE